MYRSKLWTMRMFAGFGTATDTNERFRELLEAGGDGLSTAFDLPTLMGRDSDDPLAEGEVGKCGVAVDTLADMEDLYAGIDLGSVTTSMTINSPAAVIFAMYVAVAEKTGVERARLGGTLQNDILKEYQAQKEFIFPPRPSMRLVRDTIEFTAAEMPRWHPVSISGYHIREAGSTAAQELAFTLANGFAYVELAQTAGLAVDAFAPRLSFFFNAHIDFFEEIAKYRAARRIWARWMRDRYGATDPKSMQLRFHTQTAGVSLTAQQPELNIARTAIEALAGVLGGTQSLHTNSMDEAMALPTEKAARIALRTQQLIGLETGVANVADPLGGSWYVEALTDEMERQAEAIFAHAVELRRRLDPRGGVLGASTRAGSRARSPTPPTSSSASSTRAGASRSRPTPSPMGTTIRRSSCLRNHRRARAEPGEAARKRCGPIATTTPCAGRFGRRWPPMPPRPRSTSCPRSSTPCALRHRGRDHRHPGRGLRPPRRDTRALTAPALIIGRQCAPESGRARMRRWRRCGARSAGVSTGCPPPGAAPATSPWSRPWPVTADRSPPSATTCSRVRPNPWVRSTSATSPTPANRPTPRRHRGDAPGDRASGHRRRSTRTRTTQTTRTRQTTRRTSATMSPTS